MISLVTAEEQLISICEDNPFGCRIISCAQAYGLGRPFALFWQGNGGAFSLLDGVMTLCGKIEDAEETKAFLRASGAAVIVCSQENAKRLSYPAEKSGRILKSNPVGDISAIYPNQNPDIREIYRLLCTCESKKFPVPQFEPFYLDLSHRFRHGAAVGTAVSEEGKIAACAVASAVTNSQAVLSAVAVNPENRHKGLGTQVVQEICARLAGRTLWAFRAQDENELFYEKLGFSDCGKWVQCPVV